MDADTAEGESFLFPDYADFPGMVCLECNTRSVGKISAWSSLPEGIVESRSSTTGVVRALWLAYYCLHSIILVETCAR